MVHRFVLNVDVNFAGKYSFVLMEEESQAGGIVGEEITVNTTNRKSSVFFVVAVKYVLTADRNHHVKNVER